MLLDFDKFWSFLSVMISIELFIGAVVVVVGGGVDVVVVDGGVVWAWNSFLHEI